MNTTVIGAAGTPGTIEVTALQSEGTCVRAAVHDPGRFYVAAGEDIDVYRPDRFVTTPRRAQ
ncbi:hypothetical protein [Mycolicibacterium smegmatis]|uniref:hypothetical protein n=1 Tax=Mycolicibacterium smegmatis TaxID=1772 RepID=UPI001EFB7A53|nr:hypothetical protein [Mycolicibacterium smegmatis]ULN38186.1 hypothetical protein KZ781_15050 [Mycolicibacterium smegmatis]